MSEDNPIADVHSHSMSSIGLPERTTSEFKSAEAKPVQSPKKVRKSSPKASPKSSPNSSPRSSPRSARVRAQEKDKDCNSEAAEFNDDDATIFDKLYKNAKLLQTKKRLLEMDAMPEPVQKPIRIPEVEQVRQRFFDLHNDAMEWHKERNEREKYKVDQDAAGPDLTFHPKINNGVLSKSIILPSKERHPDPFTRLYDNATETKKTKQEKIEVNTIKAQQEIEKSCTYHPSCSQKATRSRSLPQAECCYKLYQEGVKTRERLKQKRDIQEEETRKTIHSGKKVNGDWIARLYANEGKSKGQDKENQQPAPAAPIVRKENIDVPVWERLWNAHSLSQIKSEIQRREEAKLNASNLISNPEEWVGRLYYAPRVKELQKQLKDEIDVQEKQKQAAKRRNSFNVFDRLATPRRDSVSGGGESAKFKALRQSWDVPQTKADEGLVSRSMSPSQVAQITDRMELLNRSLTGNTFNISSSRCTVPVQPTAFASLSPAPPATVVVTRQPSPVVGKPIERFPSPLVGRPLEEGHLRNPYAPQKEGLQSFQPLVRSNSGTRIGRDTLSVRDVIQGRSPTSRSRSPSPIPKTAPAPYTSRYSATHDRRGEYSAQARFPSPAGDRQGGDSFSFEQLIAKGTNYLSTLSGSRGEVSPLRQIQGRVPRRAEVNALQIIDRLSER